jgi:hypothetical protein
MKRTLPLAQPPSAARISNKGKYNKYHALKNCTQARFTPLATEIYERAAPKCNMLLHLLPGGLSTSPRNTPSAPHFCGKRIRTRG